MVKHGLRAQLKSGNLLTGQLTVALDFFPKPRSGDHRGDGPAPVPHHSQQPGGTAGNAITVDQELEKLPLDKLIVELREAVKSLDTTLKSANTMVKHVDADVLPEQRRSWKRHERPWLARSRYWQATRHCSRTCGKHCGTGTGRPVAASILLDDSYRHPESLIRGKQEDKP